MIFVPDATAAVAALVDDGPVGRWAAELLSTGPLVAPHLLPAEVANVLRRRALAGAISDERASEAHAALEHLDVRLVPYEHVAERAWTLRGAVTAYDAWYVAVAEDLDVPLVTLDRRLARAPGPRCAFELPPPA
ncbi:MAG: hypothetical protein QOD86_2042 [Miltoncostaeaceae bacterium]|nr:hypothetical protein [Miltoncostaeaceae bacterium]